jgi:hypothetical protein
MHYQQESFTIKTLLSSSQQSSFSMQQHADHYGGGLPLQGKRGPS